MPLKAGGLKLDAEVSSVQVRRWLGEVAELFFNVVAKRYER